MAEYLAGRIEKGKLGYTAVIAKYGQFKSEIDRILIEDGFGNLIVS